MEAGREIASTEFWRFAQFAAEEQLEYLVIGGMALNFHAILRNTIDSDIWINPRQTHFKKLKSVLLKMGYENTELSFLDALSETEPFIFGIEGPIEFLTQVHSGFFFPACFERALFHHIDRTRIPVLGLTDLRELKIRSGRPQDLRDVLLIDAFLEKQK